MNKLEELQGRALAAAKAAREVAEKAVGEGRSMTDDERHIHDQKMAEGQDLLGRIKTLKADQAVIAGAKELADQIGEPQESVDRSARGRAKSLGLTLVESDQYKSAIAAAGGSVSNHAGFRSDPVKVKSLFTGASATSAGAFVSPDRTDIVETLGRPVLNLRSLISLRRTTSDQVEYVEQTSHTNAAAVVPEATTAAGAGAESEYTAGSPPTVATTLSLPEGSGVKPEGAWAYAEKVANVVTIAEWVPATKRAISDAAQLEGLINDELVEDLREREEDQFINGSGSGNNIRGILATSGVQTQSSSVDIFETVRKAITKVQYTGKSNVSAVLVSPEDEEKIDLARDDNDKFIGAGPFVAGQRTLWGRPVVVSQALAAGTAIVGDFAKAVVWDREDASVSVTDSHADFFIRNMVAVLAEERLAFAVTRPKSFCIATIS
ncbi:MAG: phage major capsid protein [Candidatus Nanopelagicales bacterium]